MALSRTWQQRLHRWRGGARRAGVAALTVAAIFGAAAGCKVFLAPDRPDFAGIAQRERNQQSIVGAFASDFVVAWRTATESQRDSLQRFMTLPEQGLALPSTPAAVITAPQVGPVLRMGAVGDAEIYTAVISVNERPYVSAQPTRTFYQVAVSLWNSQPRALDFPAQINDPGPGADFKLDYRHALAADSPVFAVVAGFIRTYLTATNGLDRYVVAGAPLRPIGGYQSAVVSAAATSRSVPDTPAPGEQLHVRATVVAQTSQFATVNLVYPLTVENSGGTWMVAAIDLIPQVGTQTDADPVAKPHR
ncbi:conjugal transfer protein [Mycobacterium lehmannii]|uniref:conjugal transfer protein n=1 Tax=Mycobacterium lehmannii TaxID=2048550 RepID=UPI000B93A520|nr:conjugal transfer protein [Mycobacterium lehmannii]